MLVRPTADVRAGNPPRFDNGEKEKEEIIISNQPVIFNIRYTPYALKKGATEKEIEKHRQERAFFDMSGEKNVYEYINAEKKRQEKKAETVQEYFEKNHGVFNGDGFLSPTQVEELKKRAQDGKKNIWHGFVSINKENSYRIETPEQCMRLVKRNFGQFFREMGLEPKNVDLLCALHLDREKHYHIHFAFWEKEPRCKYRKKETEYRHKGKIQQKVIDNMRVRLSLYVTGKTDEVHHGRDEALRQLRALSGKCIRLHTDDDIKRELISLCKNLPAGIPFEYGRKEMQSYRARIDKIATMLFLRDREALKADERVSEKFGEIRKQIKEICEGTATDEKYHFKIDPDTITLVDVLEKDYDRRVGNIVLHAAKFIKAEHYERSPRRKYKVNDKKLKRSLVISERNVAKRFDSLFMNFTTGILDLERDFSHRLQDIEEEIEEKRKQEEQRIAYEEERQRIRNSRTK